MGAGTIFLTSGLGIGQTVSMFVFIRPNNLVVITKHVIFFVPFFFSFYPFQKVDKPVVQIIANGVSVIRVLTNGIDRLPEWDGNLKFFSMIFLELEGAQTPFDARA